MLNVLELIKFKLVNKKYALNYILGFRTTRKNTLNKINEIILLINNRINACYRRENLLKHYQIHFVPYQQYLLLLIFLLYSTFYFTLLKLIGNLLRSISH